MLNFDDQQQIELRSDEVQEILGTPPSWLVRWGTTVTLLSFMMLLLAGWLVRYPDVIPARIVLTTANPPVEVVARADGRIESLLMTDKESVSAGQPLVVLSSTANFNHIQQLTSDVIRWQNLPLDSLALEQPATNLDLGPVQSDYSLFLQNLEAYRFGVNDKSRSLVSNISSTREQISGLEQGIQLDLRAKQRAINNLSSARDIFSRQEGLYQQGILSKMVLEQERQKVSDAERAVDQYDESILRKRNDIASLRKNITDASSTDREADASQSVRLQGTLNALRTSLDQWKQNYLLVAPVDGQVSLNAAYFSEQQFVRKDEIVLTIVPPSDNRIFGRLTLPAAGSGKVKTGQRVVVKLDSYPFHEFGTLEGTVESKALVSKDNQYNIMVSFPPKLQTSYRKSIPFEQQLQGAAEIVTEDKRFLERILEQIFAAGR
ncbi:MAG: HlyD family efflux transporter periplasmic adaptor subunit [Lewinellaceae bacterium]|nr:HlyD family efflux transporter periplasmic adaptor subunit [Lewinellaceae bacterium]